VCYRNAVYVKSIPTEVSSRVFNSFSLKNLTDRKSEQFFTLHINPSEHWLILRFCAWLQIGEPTSAISRVQCKFVSSSFRVHGWTFPFWEAMSRSAGQEIFCSLWKRKVRYHVHNSPALICILNKMNPATSSHPASFKIRFNIIVPNLHLGLTSSLFTE
jgi:hypothetical protein